MKGIKRVIKLESNALGGLGAKTIYKSGKKSKKTTLLLRPGEKTVRKLAKSNKIFIDTYLGRHKKSNCKKRNGWIADMGSNVVKANIKAVKKLY